MCLELGIISAFRDLTSRVIEKQSTLPLRRLMAICNDSYDSLLLSAHLEIHRPFRVTADETEAGIYANICRQSAAVL